MWIFIDTCTLPHVQTSLPPQGREDAAGGRRPGSSCPFTQQALLSTYYAPGTDVQTPSGWWVRKTNKIKANRRFEIANGAVMG